MNITSIDLLSNNSFVANLDLRNPSSTNSYLILDATGLDAEDITPRFYGNSTTSGTKQYGLTIPKRDIALRIGLNPNYSLGESVSSLRDRLYRMIASSRSGVVELIFKNGETSVAKISGFITKFESPRFTRTPEVLLTIKSLTSFIKAVNPVWANVAGLSANVSVTDSISTAPHGFVFAIRFNTNSQSITIRDDQTPEWTFKITPGNIAGFTGFSSLDVLYVSTEEDNKAVYVDRNGSGTIYQIADSIEAGSTWPLIFPGVNNFQAVASNEFVNFEWLYLGYVPTFWGI